MIHLSYTIYKDENKQFIKFIRMKDNRLSYIKVEVKTNENFIVSPKLSDSDDSILHAGATLKKEEIRELINFLKEVE